MKVSCLLATLLLAIPALSSALGPGITLDYVSNQSINHGGHKGYSNAQTIDLSTSRVVVLGYGGGSFLPSLWYYDTESGQPVEPYYNDFTSLPRSNGIGTLTNFAGTIKDGRLFYYDSSTGDAVFPAGGQIGLISNINSPSVVAASPLSSQLFARNMTICGDGEVTWIASVGEGDGINARCRLFKATDSSLTSFTEQGVLHGAALAAPGTGKAGVALAPPAAPAQPPEWIATCDIVGDIDALRLWHRTGTDTDPDFGYTLASQYNQKCVDARFHIARNAGETSVIIALMRPPGGVDGAAHISMFSFNDGQLKLIARLLIPYSQASYSVADRGSVNIDEANHMVYASWNDYYINGTDLSRFTLVRARYTPSEGVDLALDSSLSAAVAPQNSHVSAAHSIKNKSAFTATTTTLVLHSSFVMSNFNATTPFVTFTNTGHDATVVIAPHAPGVDISVTHDLATGAPGDGVLTAVVSSNERELNPADNATMVSLHVVPVLNNMSCSIQPERASFLPSSIVHLVIGVHNAVASPVVEPFTLRLLFSDPIQVIGHGVTPLASIDLTGQIDANATDATVPLDIRLPITPGIFAIAAEVIPANSETDPSDNFANAALTVLEVADLSISLVSDATELRNGDMTTITAFVHNAGDSPIEAIAVQETIYGGALVGYTAYAGVVEVQPPDETSWTIPVLAAHETTALAHRVVATSDPLRMVARVSSLSTLPDPDITNNVAEVSVIVTRGNSDLRARWEKRPAYRLNSSETTATIAAGVKVKNIGKGESPKCRLCFYMSNDIHWDEGDVLLLDRPVEKLNRKEHITIKLQRAIAASELRPFLIAFLDYGNALPGEVDEMNNQIVLRINFRE